MWQAQWLKCCGELAQWDVVAEVGQATDNQALMIEALWRQGDFASLRSTVFPKALVRPAQPWCHGLSCCAVIILCSCVA